MGLRRRSSESQEAESTIIRDLLSVSWEVKVLKIGVTKTWKAIYVNSRAEKKVMETLLAKDIEAYAPIVKTMRQWSDRKKIVELPLINGYVFVNTDTMQNDAVLQTRAVVGFVKSGGTIAVIRSEEIERLKQLVELGYHLESRPGIKAIDAGDKVKITSGSLKNIEGVVLRVGDNRILEVALNTIGHTIRVRLPREILSEIC
jgi:transcription antitermination factor NusG